MKINPSFILKMLTPVAKITGNRALPICDSVHLSESGFHVTNLLNHALIPYKGLPDNVCIDYRDFMDTLKVFGNQIIDMDTAVVSQYESSTRYQITFTDSQGVSMKLSGEDGNLFPDLPDFVPGAKITVPNISGYVSFASTDELRPVMCNVLIGKDLASTNAHILKYEPNPYYKDGNPDVLISANVAKLFCNTTRTIEVSQDSEWAKIHIDFGYVFSKICTDKYVDYRNAIPSGRTVFAITDRKRFIKAVETCLPALNKTTYLIRVNFSNTEIKLTATDIDFDKEMQVCIPCEWNLPEPLQIGFNARLLLQILKDITEDNVTVYLQTPNQAAVINDRYLLMPVKINDID